MSRVRVKKQPGKLGAKPETVEDLEKVGGAVRVASRKFRNSGALRRSFRSIKKGTGFAVAFDVEYARDCDTKFGTFKSGEKLKDVLNRWLRS